MIFQLQEFFRCPLVGCRVLRRPAAWLVLIVLGLLFAPAAKAQYASLLMDAGTGRVLHETNADAIRYPASLTKMMTLYMLFDALDAGRIGLNDPIPVSSYAASQSPTKLGLRPGQSISVENAILALVTKSANDIACAIAEHLGGSEPTFAALMTQRAHELGMHQTNFANASGLPDPNQTTTARDMAMLGLALLKDHPNRYHYFSTERFYYGGSVHPNHNRLLGSYYGLDGIKTGYTYASGFNLVASAQRGSQRLIGVVMGARSLNNRALIMTSLLDQGFAGDEVITAAGAPTNSSQALRPIAAASLAGAGVAASRAVADRSTRRERAVAASSRGRSRERAVAARAATAAQSCRGSGSARRCTAVAGATPAASRKQVASASARTPNAKPAPVSRVAAKAKPVSVAAAPARREVLKSNTPAKPAKAAVSGKIGKTPPPVRAAGKPAKLAEGRRNPSS